MAEGKLDDQFPVDVFQTGSGTSSNMNANEVIANRAIELAGGDRFAPEKPIHPNDHVNMGQSTNDTFPTAIHVAVAVAIEDELIPALAGCRRGAGREGRRSGRTILKIGRTHLADATPLSLGQEIGGLARQLELSVDRARRAIEAVLELPVGGTAVGSGINTHPEFGRRVCRAAGRGDGHPVRRGGRPFRGQRPARRAGRVPRPVARDRRHAVQRGQQHPLARLRARGAGSTR